MTILRRVDPFLAALLGAVALASFLPVSGSAAEVFDWIVVAAVAWLFFLYGVRLRTDEAIAAVRDWRLHSVILACTYVLFPLLGLAAILIPDQVLPADLARGFLFLTLLPSTVQSSIAFVSIARGNVAGAIVSASFSNLAGVIITPLLVALFMGTQVGFSAGSIVKIGVQILLPFIVGQFARRWLAGWVTKHRAMTTLTDRGAVVFVVYAAFSKGVVDGIWSRVSVADILAVTALSMLVLAAVLWLTWAVGGWLKFSRQDRITILMCGSKKSLATGVPMANVLFPAATLGLIMLPVIIFHQLQLIVCAIIAKRLGTRSDPINVPV